MEMDSRLVSRDPGHGSERRLEQGGLILLILIAGNSSNDTRRRLKDIHKAGCDSIFCSFMLCIGCRCGI